MFLTPKCLNPNTRTHRHKQASNPKRLKSKPTRISHILVRRCKFTVPALGAEMVLQLKFFDCLRLQILDTSTNTWVDTNDLEVSSLNLLLVDYEAFLNCNKMMSKFSKSSIEWSMIKQCDPEESLWFTWNSQELHKATRTYLTRHLPKLPT